MGLDSNRVGGFGWANGFGLILPPLISSDPSAKHLKLDHSALAFAPSTASVGGYRDGA